MNQNRRFQKVRWDETGPVPGGAPPHPRRGPADRRQHRQAALVDLPPEPNPARAVVSRKWTGNDAPHPLTQVSCPRSPAGPHRAGLSLAADPSKHLARFLTRSLQNVQASDKLGALVGGSRAGGPALMPTAVLFNGGVFKAGPIRARVLDLASWNGGQAVRELEGFEPAPGPT